MGRSDRVALGSGDWRLRIGVLRASGMCRVFGLGSDERAERLRRLSVDRRDFCETDKASKLLIECAVGVSVAYLDKLLVGGRKKLAASAAR